VCKCCKANGNRYEGSWQNGVKSGPGQFFYLDKGQVYEGVWVDDLAKCGEMKDWNRESAPDATQFPLPPVSSCTRNSVASLFVNVAGVISSMYVLE